MPVFNAAPMPEGEPDAASPGTRHVLPFSEKYEGKTVYSVMVPHGKGRMVLEYHYLRDGTYMMIDAETGTWSPVAYADSFDGRIVEWNEESRNWEFIGAIDG